ncbi:hydroxymethylglutaryl-CoA lyase [Effusibacillus dendaii]|uniref:Hydroxymethylglutaryl-CoA lyase YngG n=1 Tax=Effusibacillus dendaii TaxID=2743772 RepID=A0A7I8DET1_9BACL|nr:hydroxymethylglutaryl-CoA lyase [Effusibacillus dendaii]BCJ88547.1 hydroxymethylglutaryl-CoA lyase YngG [Effusibacillus dendaii]
MNQWPKSIEIVEVGPRDGLQNEQDLISTPDKIRLIQKLAESGVKRIEVTSFVSPKWVPQMADAAEVLAGIQLPDDVQQIALIPNEKGYERAKECGVNAIALVVGASSTFNQKNINMTTEESMQRLRPLVEQAKQDGMFVRAYVATTFGCPYENEVPLSKVLTMVEQFLAMGADEIDLADTIGIANPKQVFEVFTKAKAEFPQASFTAHFHDTRGMALANTLAAMQAGVTSFDTAIGGLGGCPFAKGAAGNGSTEDLVYMLESMGISTGLQIGKLYEAVDILLPLTKRQLMGHLYKVRDNGVCVR